MVVTAEKQKVHLHVHRQKGICGGEVLLTGTRIPV